MQDEQTRSVAGRQPAPQQQQTRQREEQEGDVPVTMYDIELRDIPVGDDMPALRYRAQVWCESDAIRNVLRRPEGCTIEALVIDPRACCKSDESVRALQQLPWWRRAQQMRSLVDEGLLTLGHWAALNADHHGSVPAIRDVLDTRVAAQQQAAAGRGAATSQLIRQRMSDAVMRSEAAEAALQRYLEIVRAMHVAVEQARAEERERAAENAALRASAATTQPQQLPPLDMYGQEKRQFLSPDVGRALYDSVYGAEWGALQYTAVGVHAKTPQASEGNVALPIVPCGTLPGTLVMDESCVAAAQRASDAPDVLTLYSPLGWPAMWKLTTLPERALSSDEVAQRVKAACAAQQLAPGSDDYKNTLFVRGEVQRAWRCIVSTRDKAQPLRQGSTTTQGTATAAAAATAQAQDERHSNVAQSQAAQGSAARSQSSASSSKVAANNKDAFIILRGTPGIGKTMAIGGYVLYKLLHDESERALPYVLFEVYDLSFVFDKRNKTVACYERDSFKASLFVRAVDQQCARIFDCSKTHVYSEEESKKGAKLNIVITSPNTNNILDIRNKNIDDGLLRYAIVHAWSLREMLLVSRYLGIDETAVTDRVTKVGPLPRYVYGYDQVKFNERVRDIDYALSNDAVTGIDIPLCSFQVDAVYNKDNPTNKVFDLRRATDEPDDTATQDEKKAAAVASDSRRPKHSFYYVPLSVYTKDALIQVMLQRQQNNELYFGSVLCSCIDDPNVFESCVIQFFATQAMWAYIAGADNGVPRCVYIPCGGDGAAADEPGTPLRHDTLRAWLTRMAEHSVLCFDDGATITFDTRDGMRVFKPLSDKFPLIDAFVLLYCAERVHYIGIQVTVRDSHKPSANNIRSFYNSHPAVTLASADDQKRTTRSLTRVTAPTGKVDTHINSATLKNVSVDVLDEKVLGNVKGTRSMLYVKKHTNKIMSYEKVKSEANLPEAILKNWEAYAQYCCRVRASDVHPTAKFTTQEAKAERDDKR